MPDKSMKKVLDGVDKVAEDIRARDRADIKKVQERRDVYKLAAGATPAHPKEFGKALSDSEIMNAAESAEREHLSGSLYGGRGAKDYESLQSEGKALRAKHKVPNQDPNARLRKK
jgi:hypothetical protein